MKPVKLSDLCPMDTELTLRGKKYKLEKFSLYHQAWANEAFKENGVNGTEVMFNKIADNDVECVVLLLFRLMGEQKDYASPEDLMRKLDFTDVPNIVNPLMRAIGLSQPPSDDLKDVVTKKKRKVTRKKA